MPTPRLAPLLVLPVLSVRVAIGLTLLVLTWICCIPGYTLGIVLGTPLLALAIAALFPDFRLPAARGSGARCLGTPIAAVSVATLVMWQLEVEVLAIDRATRLSDAELKYTAHSGPMPFVQPDAAWRYSISVSAPSSWGHPKSGLNRGLYDREH